MHVPYSFCTALFLCARCMKDLNRDGEVVWRHSFHLRNRRTNFIWILYREYTTEVEGFWRLGVIMCNIALLDFVHLVNYKITIWKLDSASVFWYRGEKRTENLYFGPLVELSSDLNNKSFRKNLILVSFCSVFLYTKLRSNVIYQFYKLPIVQ
jgi:hypothetical protein